MVRALRRNAESATCRPIGIGPDRGLGKGIPAAGAGPNRSPGGNPALKPAVNNVLELLRPGSFVRLLDQPRDLPPFQLIHCRGGRCWVRQQSWGPYVHWEVAHRRLSRIP
jgi:hypothetical protein